MQITTTQKQAIDHTYQYLVAYQEKKVTLETAVMSSFGDNLRQNLALQEFEGLFL